MGLVLLQNERLRLAVDPALGAGIADFSVAGPAKFFYPLMRRAAAGEASPSLLGCFTMAPWCNRIRGAAFRFGGREHRLRPAGADPNAMHGDVRARPWRILDRSPFSASFSFDSRDAADVNFPWPFEARIRYQLSPDTLAIDLSVTNLAADSFPAGCGLHPYFPRRLWDDRDDVHIRVPCAARYPLENSLPSGPPAADDLTRRLRELHPLPEQALDAVFAGYEGDCEIRWPASGLSLRMQSSANLKHVVVFAPRTPGGGPLPFFAVEPVSQVNDGFNLLASGDSGSGTAVLQPGKSLRVSYSLTAVASA